jgi:hypothetical protein
MSIKRKSIAMTAGRDKHRELSQLAAERLERARVAHAKGVICMEDYIWTAMQCYTSESATSTKNSRIG